MNILIGIPSPSWIAPAFALDNLPAIIAFTKSNLKGLDNLFIRLQEGVRTDRNRNIILNDAIKLGGVDYVLWLDTDMLFQPDIICRYLEQDFDIIGCIYFKRSAPFSPVAYLKGDNPLKPYKAIDPRTLPSDTVVEVDGLGYGGMMVKMSVYEAMGEDKWTVYGRNFHLPFEAEDALTHDLEFCKRAQGRGFKISLHTGVRPGHIAERVITEADWDRPRSSQRISVIIPATDMTAALKAGQLMKKRAGVDCEVVVAEDVERTGYVATVNQAVKNNPSDFYVYTAQDAFVGENWLKIAMDKMEATQAGLLAFNNGRWHGQLASFGLVRHSWLVDIYGGNLFYPGYKSHYGDTELTVIAKDQDKFTYDPDAVMTEVDYDKDKKGVNLHDKDLFAYRKLSLFDNKVTSRDIANSFS